MLPILNMAAWPLVAVVAPAEDVTRHRGRPLFPQLLPVSAEVQKLQHLQSNLPLLLPRLLLQHPLLLPSPLPDQRLCSETMMMTTIPFSAEVQKLQHLQNHHSLLLPL